ncbi:MAG: glutathione S-transferase family protein [Methylobacteriaceae bacterium]|nr:glutathione S-transferase family protein [Methylobacteriaceae bacterium]
MAKITLYGFSGSTYVRTIRMLLAEKGVGDYEQVPVDVLKGETRHAEHLTRHPFGKVPVVEVDGFRVIETNAIARYLNAILPGPSLVPADPKDAARMDMVTGILDSYGYGAMVGGVAAYHLFPDFVGGKNDEAHGKALALSRQVLVELMRIKGASRFLAGDAVSLADLYLAPPLFYVSLTPHKDEILAIDGLAPWWEAITARPSFASTSP